MHAAPLEEEVEDPAASVGEGAELTVPGVIEVAVEVSGSVIIEGATLLLVTLEAGLLEPLALVVVVLLLLLIAPEAKLVELLVLVAAATLLLKTLEAKVEELLELITVVDVLLATVLEVVDDVSEDCPSWLLTHPAAESVKISK